MSSSVPTGERERERIKEKEIVSSISNKLQIKMKRGQKRESVKEGGKIE